MHRPTSFALALTLFVTVHALAASPPPIRRAGEQRFGFADLDAPRVGLSYFDDAAQPAWNDMPIHQRATGACDTDPAQRSADGRALYPRRTRMLGPRVDERQCPRPGGAGTDATLIGFDSTGTVTWQRPLAFISGERRIDQWLIGATPEGLVLSSLEVWSPRTGETVVPARTHPVGIERRPVPDEQLTGTAVYHPKRREILLFAADVTLIRRQGGLYRIDLGTGTHELLRAVSAGLTGTYERAEAMALSADGRLLFLARRSTVRDSSPVSFAVFDLESRRYVFQERHGEGHACSEPRVVAGPAGQVAFSYRDHSDRQNVVVTYHVSQPTDGHVDRSPS